MGYQCVDCGALMGGEHSDFDERPTICDQCAAEALRDLDEALDAVQRDVESCGA